MNHLQPPTREQLVNSTKIIARDNDKTRLTIKEAFSILHLVPSINKQYDNFKSTIKLHPHRSIHKHISTIPNNDEDEPPDEVINDQPEPDIIPVPVTLSDPVHSEQAEGTQPILIVPSNNPVSPGIQHRINTLISQHRNPRQNNPTLSPIILRSTINKQTKP